MKKIFTYFGIFLSVVLMGALSSCTMQELDPGSDVGLGIKVFSPTKVVPGQPMTINGTGLGDVKEIVFPDGVSVTNFEVVSKEMIRVIAPNGISAEGGKLILRTEKEQVESRLPMTLGSTAVSGFSKQPGEEVNGGEQITIFGKDLEFINAVELLDADGNTNLISHNDFYRKGTNNVIFIVPEKNIFDGTFVGKVYTYDGKSFDMPEWTYKPKQGGGHWEIVKTIFWENDGTKGVVDWGNVSYRFGLDGKDGNKECDATFPADVWSIIKDGTFRVSFDCNESSNIRITTGWWSGAYGGTEHNCIDMVQEDEDGTKYLELNIKEEGSLYDLIDDQHFLITGSACTPLAIYTQEEIWVEDPDGHWEITSFWKNDGTKGAVDWGNVSYRFGLDGKDGNNECDATFPADVWSVIKDGTFRVSFDCNESSNIRITTGWWSGAYGGTEHNCIDMIQEDEDGTKYLELNIKEEGSLYDLIDDQHFLITGSNCTPLEIYTKVWVEGAAPKEEVVLWEGEAIADDWGNQPYLLSDGGVELQAAGAQPGQEIRFYITPTDTFWQLEIVEGHWSGVTYAAYSSPDADDGGRFTAWDLDANGGYVPLTITQEMLDAAYVQQWWGGTFIGNADNVKITKITLY